MRGSDLPTGENSIFFPVFEALVLTVYEFDVLRCNYRAMILIISSLLLF